jgi:hypothetical protein
VIIETIAVIRWEAALELVKAVDTMVLLEQCERATGRSFVRDADRARISRARSDYLAVRPAASVVTVAW